MVANARDAVASEYQLFPSEEVLANERNEDVSRAYEEDDELPEGSEAAIRKIKSNVRETVRNWSFAMPKLDHSARGFNVTPKFAKLLQILKSCRPQGDIFRGIIFGELNFWGPKLLCEEILNQRS